MICLRFPGSDPPGHALARQEAVIFKKRRKPDEGWPLATVKEEGARPLPLAVVEGTVERMVPGGLGLLRDDEGIVLVRGGLVGEKVRAEVESRRGGVRHGDVVHVSAPSPERVEPDCSLHPRCGGCDLLDLSERAQGDAKQEIVEDALRRIGRLGDGELARVAPLSRAPLFARARRRARLKVDDTGAIGFYARRTHELVALDGCPALAAPLEGALHDLLEAELSMARLTLHLACDDEERVSMAVEPATSRRDGERIARRVVEAGIATGSLVLSGRGRPARGFGDATLFGEIAPGCAGGPYRSDAATFTQASRFGGEAILHAVVEGAAGARAVLELFAGAGHLTLPLAERGARVLAVEGDAHACDWLVKNADQAPFASRIEAHRARVGEHTLDALVAGESFDVLVADPPRTGIDGLAALLGVLDVERVVLVSCDPATGARDLRIALDHGYSLAHLVPIDAFPRTSHVEWVATLARRAA